MFPMGNMMVPPLGMMHPGMPHPGMMRSNFSMQQVGVSSEPAIEPAVCMGLLDALHTRALAAT